MIIDSGHIDGINGAGTIKKLREFPKTEKTKNQEVTNEILINSFFFDFKWAIQFL